MCFFFHLFLFDSCLWCVCMREKYIWNMHDISFYIWESNVNWATLGWWMQWNYSLKLFIHRIQFDENVTSIEANEIIITITIKNGKKQRHSRFFDKRWLVDFRKSFIIRINSSFYIIRMNTLRSSRKKNFFL